MKDKSRYSAASKKRWAVIAPEERSKAMGVLAKKKWSQVSKEDRVKHARMMLEVKRKNNGKTESTEEQEKE